MVTCVPISALGMLLVIKSEELKWLMFWLLSASSAPGVNELIHSTYVRDTCVCVLRVVWCTHSTHMSSLDTLSTLPEVSNDALDPTCPVCGEVRCTRL